MTKKTARPEMKEEARSAGLRHVNDSKAGISRRRRGKTFQYLSASGKVVHDPEDLDRIRRLAIPPAWENVWICPYKTGHLQAVGRDARGRKQYRYHPGWRVARDETKYGHTISFGKALPRIRRRVRADLKQPGLSRRKVLATVVRLLETTLIRVGNDEYARENESYGLTTMRDHHVRIKKDEVTFSFKGKSGKTHSISLQDAEMAAIVRKCRDLPGYELFQYKDDSHKVVDITSGDVNQYLKDITGEDYTAKDFRTWAGTVLAAKALSEFEKFKTTKEAKRNIVTAVEAVACMLGNTPAICRKCYVHPVVFDTYLEGSLLEQLKKRAEKKLTSGIEKLKPDEAAVMMLLQQTLTK